MGTSLCYQELRHRPYRCRMGRFLGQIRVDYLTHPHRCLHPNYRRYHPGQSPDFRKDRRESDRLHFQHRHRQCPGPCYLQCRLRHCHGSQRNPAGRHLTHRQPRHCHHRRRSHLRYRHHQYRRSGCTVGDQCRNNNRQCSATDIHIVPTVRGT